MSNGYIVTKLIRTLFGQGDWILKNINFATKSEPYFCPGSQDLCVCIENRPRDEIARWHALYTMCIEQKLTATDASLPARHSDESRSDSDD